MGDVHTACQATGDLHNVMGLCKGTQNLVDGTRQYLRAFSGSTVSGGPSMESMQDSGPGHEL